jgi:hypothetical protein
MSATVRRRGVARFAAVAVGAMTLAALAVPARAQFTLVDFGVTSLPPLTSARMTGPYARSVLLWPGAARLPVVMP